MYSSQRKVIPGIKIGSKLPVFIKENRGKDSIKLVQRIHDSPRSQTPGDHRRGQPRTGARAGADEEQVFILVVLEVRPEWT